MGNEKVTVVARLTAQPGKELQVKQELTKLLAPTRAEPGCLNYDMHQALENEAEFLFHENWASRDALNKHLETPHIKAFLSQADQLLAAPVEITLWKQTG